ncbi:MAG: hypothetical protein WA655_03560 [Candidatus Korobacteraceae bacterium]
MEEYNVSGDTKRKAVAFFLRAAQYADMPMHPLLSGQMRNSSGTRKKKAQTTKRPPEAGAHYVATPNGSDSGILAKNARSIELSSGGTVTLSLSYDPFALSGEDRKFVFELVDKLKAYAEANPPTDEREYLS